MVYKLISNKIVDTRTDNVIIRGDSDKLQKILKNLKTGYAFGDFTPDFFCQERPIRPS